MVSINQNNNCQVYINKASETFKKSIPFKIYYLSNKEMSGTHIHTHDYMQVWYVNKGCLEHVVNDKRHILIKGTIFVLPPFVAHQVNRVPEEEVSILGCEFSTDFINENITFNINSINYSYIDSSLFDFAYLEPFLVSTENIKPGLLLNGTTQSKVESLFDEMLYEFNNEKKYFEINIKADLLKLLAIISREYEKEYMNQNNGKTFELFEKYKDAINKTIIYINENYSEDLSLEDASKMSMLSQAYFSFIFKQITGKTFVEYKNALRIAKAIDLMRDKSMSITDICYVVGFNDTAYFSKIFKKDTGISPSQYRKAFYSK